MVPVKIINTIDLLVYIISNGSTKTTDEFMVGYYVITFISYPVILQANNNIYVQVLNAGNISLKE